MICKRCLREIDYNKQLEIAMGAIACLLYCKTHLNQEGEILMQSRIIDFILNAIKNYRFYIKGE